MKIEVGKSLISSWLKHAKSCQIVQTNWQPSVDTLEINNEELLDEIIGDIHNKFFVEMNYELFNTKTTASEIVKENTINLTGLELNKCRIKKVYAVETRFVEDGRTYGTTAEITEDILRKMMGMAIATLAHFDCKKGEVIFASPIVSRTVSEKLDDICVILTDYFNGKWNMDFTFRAICNNEFKSRIVDVIHALSESIIDESELYMRSIQIYNNFSKGNRINRKAYGESGVSSGKRKYETGYDEIKVDALVKTTFSEIELLEEEILKLSDHKYSKETFNIGYPLIRKIDRALTLKDNRMIDGATKYYSRIYEINNRKYLLANDWNEYNKEKYIRWFKMHLL